MNQLIIENFESEKELSLKDAALLLESSSVLNHMIKLNWENYPALPQIGFRIGHSGNAIWIKFYVTENFILAREANMNGKVHKDSCLEFFISFDGANYYNFESNCIGTVHLGYGKGRGSRIYIDPGLLRKIEIYSSLGNLPFEEKKGNFEWEIMFRIPIECFVFEKIASFAGINATANFYKCCDECTDPHFVTWNPVNTNEPDFHRPEFFGQIKFN